MRKYGEKENFLPKVNECIKEYNKATKLLDEIDERVQEFAAQKGFCIAFRDDAFSPIYYADSEKKINEKTVLMRFFVFRTTHEEGAASCGYVLILEDGTMVFREDT